MGRTGEVFTPFSAANATPTQPAAEPRRCVVGEFTNQPEKRTAMSENTRRELLERAGLSPGLAAFDIDRVRA